MCETKKNQTKPEFEKKRSKLSQYQVFIDTESDPSKNGKVLESHILSYTGFARWVQRADLT